MKKLMIAAAVVIAAVAAQATTVSWQFTETVQSAKTHADLTKYTAYLFTADAWNKISKTSGEIKNTDFVGFLDSHAISEATAATVSTYSLGGTIKKVDSSLKSLDDYYIVIADTATGGSSIWAKSITGIKTYDETDPTATPATAAGWTIGKMTTSAYLTDGNASYTMNVPEPTSAMLLLLGVAGLALRRKQK